MTEVSKALIPFVPSSSSYLQMREAAQAARIRLQQNRIDMRFIYDAESAGRHAS